MKTPEELAREEGQTRKHAKDAERIHVKELYVCIEQTVAEAISEKRINSRGGDIEVPQNFISECPGISFNIAAVQQYLGMYGWYGEARGFWTGKDKNSQVYVFSLRPLYQDPPTC